MSAFAHSRRILLTSRRIPLFTPLILLLAFALVFKYYNLADDTASLLPSFSTSHTFLNSRPALTFESDGSFWPSFAPLLAAAAPRVEPPTRTEDLPMYFYHGDGVERQPNVLQWSRDYIDSMKGHHEWFVSQLQLNPPKLPYKPKTRGIVTSAGGKYFPVLLVSLRMLRRTGSTLPVEIFLKNKEEYEEIACENLFKELGAKCIILSDSVADSKIKFNFEHYQIKSIGLLFSSFDEILFLDADNFPAYNPDHLFENEVYKQKGMVLWPDYWSCTASLFFNEIAGLDENALEDRPTIESGQFLVNKKQHADTLMLAAYYNTYGTEYFYPLLSQGGPGEGDKETFGAAALALNKTFYTVNTQPHPYGGDGAPVLQSNLDEDWAASLDNPNRNDNAPPPTPFFIHSSFGKLNPKWAQRDRRYWGPAVESIMTFGEDMEMTVWSIMVDMACEDKVQFADWGHKEYGGYNGTLKTFHVMFESEYKDLQDEEERNREEEINIEEE
ncbi:Alpha-1,2-mannosyltransferase MNN21 [Lachnellula cervina]|uniref:Alpha-1,2-mannosyltransferase MNN21 n=1 Tax=Lachnellula cervina TaxID=1316786 RepID=A0A7D8Z5W6_9HELO|nr:Alpha-1,2-mannosyltransferase MNN21 [Lachnellula cervina]